MKARASQYWQHCFASLTGEQIIKENRIAEQILSTRKSFVVIKAISFFNTYGR
jgi:hypothetical protein